MSICQNSAKLTKVSNGMINGQYILEFFFILQLKLFTKAPILHGKFLIDCWNSIGNNLKFLSMFEIKSEHYFGKTCFAKTTLNLVKLKTISKQSGVKISGVFL